VRPLREDLVTQACLEAYGAIRHEGRLSDRALDFTLRPKRNLYSNERRAVAERVYALLRRQITVDALLERARPGFKRLSGSRQDLLRLCSSRVLQGETTHMVARVGGLDRDDIGALESLPEAAADLDSLPRLERFALASSLPTFLAERFLAEFGEQAEAAAEAMNERAPLFARVNTLKTDREALLSRLRSEGVDCIPTDLSPLGISMETRINAFSLESFREGLFELQDEGSQLLGMLVDPPPTKVVDACAGAGGKTLQLAAQMKNRGELFALDIDERRMEDLRKRVRRAGVHNVRARTIPADASAIEALQDLHGKADRVLVDAPCSGSGTYRRKPDARYRLSADDLADHARRQRELLSRFSVLVKPGGRIIYGTCSVLSEENEQVVETFLREHRDFELVPPADKLGPELGAKVSRGGYLRLSPHQHGTDGFFGAILLRKK
jgi:16S rRNA (cytosine967-C5)-methyltransferase